MTNPTIEELRAEIQHLQTLVAALSATMLRNAAVDLLKSSQTLGRAEADSLVHEAEECFRCARLPGLAKEIAVGLDAAGNALMSKAVEVETLRQREARKE
jgi:hypothetical protein